MHWACAASLERTAERCNVRLQDRRFPGCASGENQTDRFYRNRSRTMRRFIVDTDTGSDDAWAIVEALRAAQIGRVEAITVVCGNFHLDLCVKNALLAAEAAETYVPPVYRGMERPLLEKRLFCADYVHGEDGLGGMNLPPSSRSEEAGHAVQAMIDLVMQNPGEIEIVTCGPLTNLAMAVLMEPAFAGNVKRAWILGGAAGSAGNLAFSVEYNVGTDPEAAHIVLHSGMDMVWVTWDTARGETEIMPAEVEGLLQSGSGAARFCALCSRDLAKYYQKKYGRDTFGVIDSMVMTAALYPEIMKECFAAECAVELADPDRRGHMYVKPAFPDKCGHLYAEPAGQHTQENKDTVQVEKPAANGEQRVLVCTKIDAAAYKRRLFALLQGENCKR